MSIYDAIMMLELGKELLEQTYNCPYEDIDYLQQQIEMDEKGIGINYEVFK